MARQVSTLPDSLPPRGLSRVQAAEYVGVGPTKFDEMVADGRMPKPKQIDVRTVWDRVLLDHAFAALPDQEPRDGEQGAPVPACAPPINKWDGLR